MRLEFYTVDAKYCDYLRKFDSCVPYVTDKKKNRPFLGVVFSLNNFLYYAPLSSPKEKHLRMKNQIDFIKIKGGALGAINLNNMIPVFKPYLTAVDVESVSDLKYKNLLNNQLTWCNISLNKKNILKKTARLYHLIVENNASPALIKRTCNFSILEKESLAYFNLNGE